MANAKVQFGHASTGKANAELQVKVGGYYSMPPTVLLRPKTKTLAEKSAALCVAACNNNNILYSQGKRDTLKRHAAELGLDASMSTEDLKEAIEAIDKTCYADCSSFMTFCATLSGASVAMSGGGIPRTANMRKWFTQNGDYKALTASKYLNGPDYLRNGDILVDETGHHTVMVIGNGAKVLFDDDDADYEQEEEVTTNDGTVVTVETNELADITVVKVALNNVVSKDTAVSGTVKITKIENEKEKSLNNTTELISYTWKSYLQNLITGEIISNKIDVKTGSANFNFKNLSPNSYYSIRVAAIDAEDKEEYSSQTMVVRTELTYPCGISNLEVSMPNATTQADKFNISFDVPKSWGTAALQKTYIVYLLVNGNVIASNETLIEVTNKKVATLLKISDFSKMLSLHNYDTLQIGVQTGLKDCKTGNIFYDKQSYVCSKPIIIKNEGIAIDKVYIGTDENYKQAIIHSVER